MYIIAEVYYIIIIIYLLAVVPLLFALCIAHYCSTSLSTLARYDEPGLILAFRIGQNRLARTVLSPKGYVVSCMLHGALMSVWMSVCHVVRSAL